MRLPNCPQTKDRLEGGLSVALTGAGDDQATALAPRDCVREARSQLLEYAYWPGSPDFNALWIVGPSPIDGETQEYLDSLRDRFGMPVGYRYQPLAASSS